jgi:hypothetical protein
MIHETEMRLTCFVCIVHVDLKPDVWEIDEEARRTRTAQRLGAGSGIGA